MPIDLNAVWFSLLICHVLSLLIMLRIRNAQFVKRLLRIRHVFNAADKRQTSNDNYTDWVCRKKTSLFPLNFRLV